MKANKLVPFKAHNRINGSIPNSNVEPTTEYENIAISSVTKIDMPVIRALSSTIVQSAKKAKQLGNPSAIDIPRTALMI